MFFRDLLLRCRDVVRLRVQNGFATERGLARRAGVSQPHLHNVLKGAKPMTADLADRLMPHLGLTLADLTDVPFRPPPPAAGGGTRSTLSGGRPPHPPGRSASR